MGDKSEAKKPAKIKKQSHREVKSKKHNIQVRTTMHSESVARFEQFPQLACEFSQYKKGHDWDYTKITSGDTEACADACLNAGDCTGFEIGIQQARRILCHLEIRGLLHQEIHDFHSPRYPDGIHVRAQQLSPPRRSRH